MWCEFVFMLSVTKPIQPITEKYKSWMRREKSDGLQKRKACLPILLFRASFHKMFHVIYYFSTLLAQNSWLERSRI